MQGVDLFCRLEVAELEHELVEIIECIRLEVIKQHKEFLRIVLYRCSSQQQNTPAWMFLQQKKSLGLLVLQPMCLINDHILERHVFEHIMQISVEHFI